MTDSTYENLNKFIRVYGDKFLSRMKEGDRLKLTFGNATYELVKKNGAPIIRKLH